MKLKVDDIVKVIAGIDRGAQGKILSVNHKTGRIIVEGVNKVYKHVRRSNRNPQGGRLSMEMPFPASNAMLVCPSCGQTTRIGLNYDEAGAKHRICRKCQASLGAISPERPRYAKS